MHLARPQEVVERLLHARQGARSGVAFQDELPAEPGPPAIRCRLLAAGPDDPLGLLREGQHVSAVHTDGVRISKQLASALSVVPDDNSAGRQRLGDRKAEPLRSEEHTSELQSLAYLVCRLLLEK